MMGMANKGIVLPDNVTYGTFTLETNVTTDNVQIPNPLKSIAYKTILIITFSEQNGVFGMYANPNSSRDSTGNRKIIIDSNGINSTNYYPWIAFTNEYITLRGATGGAYHAGIYHIFAWNKI